MTENKDVLLGVELVPKTSFFTNLRSELSKADWDIVRQLCYKKANYACEICGEKGKGHPVECHEIWEYDDRHKIQKLNGVIALCPSCHEVKHIGYAKISGRERFAINHLAKVNGWEINKAEKYVRDKFEEWRYRSKYNWKLDISIIVELMGGSHDRK